MHHDLKPPPEYARLRLIRVLGNRADQIYGMAFHPSLPMLLTSSSDSVQFWDLRTGSAHLLAKLAQGSIASIACTPDGQLLAGGDDQGALWLWDLNSGRRLPQFGKHPLAILALAFTPDGKALATGSLDGKARLLQL